MYFPMVDTFNFCIDLQVNFEKEGGNGDYPPPTLHSLLISYLIKTEDNNINLKHRLVQYVFLDMASCLSKREEQTESELMFVENLIKFPSAFSVPPSIIKLTQVKTTSPDSKSVIQCSLRP